MLSPLSKNRIVSPSKQLSSSPRGNKHGRGISGSDMLCAVFLKHFRWLLAGMVALSFVRIITMEPLNDMGNSDGSRPVRNHTTYYDQPVVRDPNALKYLEVPKTIPAVVFDSESSWDEEAEESADTTNESDVVDGVRTTESSHDDIEESNVDQSDAVAPVENTSENKNDLFASYKAANAPVILDGWNRTVQVHLVFDVTASEDVIDPASKLLMAGVERSRYLQLTTVTFVRPAIESFELFPRKPDLPLLFLIDWGSMDRDCHRLQLVLEQIRMEHELAVRTSQLEDETEEPYFLLVDSSGSTRQSRCNYLFRDIVSEDEGNSRIVYAHTHDTNRIRLAKRSIVKNRYYDNVSRKIHVGEVSPNQWDGTPEDYDRPVLHSPMSLRETFVMGIQNITGGMKLVPTKDAMRPIDVGCFWKNGDYSHYGFYRREIAKVVKTLHHSTLDKETGSLMNNEVGIAYSDSKEMAAGHVQVAYIEKILRCKIVVITQRDEWEDHYRLMESLASGALVMTDSMVALPEGFQDKVNIVVYESPKMLKDLIRYYLKPEHKDERKRIATKGYKLAMGRHRCWHRLEELLFGRPLTNANQHYAPAPPKERYPVYEYE